MQVTYVFEQDTPPYNSIRETHLHTQKQRRDVNFNPSRLQMICAFYQGKSRVMKGSLLFFGPTNLPLTLPRSID